MTKPTVLNAAVFLALFVVNTAYSLPVKSLVKKDKGSNLFGGGMDKEGWVDPHHAESDNNIWLEPVDTGEANGDFIRSINPALQPS